MRHTPKHAARSTSNASRRTVGIVLASATTLGVGVATAGSAKAEVGWNVWDKVATCESGNNWSIRNGNGFEGGLQFTHQTWVGYGGTQFASSANYASREQQIIVAQRVLRDVGPRAWPVCSVRAGLTVANGLAVKVGGGGGTTTPPPSRSSSRALVVDGSFGPLTTRATQKWVGVSQTGVFDANTKRALQRKLGVVVDGSIGPKSIAALQTKVGIARDGSSYLNSRTVMGLQRYLNAHVL